MGFRVKVISISPCGCGFEGSLRFSLLDYEKRIDCSYIGQNDKDIAEQFPVGSERTAEVIFAFATVTSTSLRTEGIAPNLIGRFVGTKDVDGDQLLVVDVGFPVLVDDELGREDGISVGDWVECSGEFSIIDTNP